MNFFRSILADDPDPPQSEICNKSTVDSTPLVPETDAGDVSHDPKPNNAWSLGGLFKDLAARSESVIEIYRKDIEEFGSGLRKESEIIRVAATRAVKDLEAGASAAHGVLKSTAEIIIPKETQITGSDGESDTPGTNTGLNSGRYSRFEAQLSALQNDLSTFCEDPDDVEEFGNWRSTFQLEEKSDEIDSLVVEGGTLEGIYKKVVPSAADRETFWCRYFYRVHKLKQQEKIRANLVRRAMSGDDDDDELSWDVDDDEEEGHVVSQETVVKMKRNDGDTGVSDAASNQAGEQSHLNENFNEEKEGATVVMDDDKNEFLVSSHITSDENSHDDQGKNGVVEDETKIVVEDDGKKEQKVNSEQHSNNENIEVLNLKAVVKDDASSHEAKEEADDLSWDEIEDVASDEEKPNSGPANHGATADMAVLRKQLNSNEDDEDLSWDIEDDDAPVES